jgi:BirA family biotin operon repressor/biotin-[acetyl-CoA-carboxylase] ligase
MGARLEGRTELEWARDWGVPRLEIHRSLGSTNDRARELAAEGAAPYTTVIADQQTRGRGRDGKSWLSAPRRGLWMSVILASHPRTNVLLAPLLVGLAVARALERTDSTLVPAIKWPNDVLLKNRKVAGVLCERTGDGPLVAGVGVNVDHDRTDFPATLHAHATSVWLASGKRVARAGLAGAILEELRSLMTATEQTLPEPVRRELSERDALRGHRVRVSTGQTGVACGIGTDGRLALRVAGQGIEHISAGSVGPIPGGQP